MTDNHYTLDEFIKLRQAAAARDDRHTFIGALGGGKHTFTISVNLRGSNANWSTDLEPQTIEAYDLPDALRLASCVAFSSWFPPEDDDDTGAHMRRWRNGSENHQSEDADDTET